MAKYLLNLAVMAGALAASSAYAQVADVALINGKIYTADAGDAVVTALAVSGNRFLAVGSDEAVRPHIGAKTQVIDLKGGFVSPGLTDAHLHNEGGGPGIDLRSEEHTYELQSLMRISYAVFCLKKKTNQQ